MARIVVSAVVAAAVFVGTGYNPVAAAQAFSFTYAATGFLDPNAQVLGPRLQDLKAPQADYGQPIPYIEGVWRVAGNYAWSSDKYEIANTATDGKGGPGVDNTTFIYKIDVLIVLSCNQCQAIRRVWSNGKLKWSNADDADADTIVASAETDAWDDIRFYSGGPTQLPDPDYEAAVGMGNAPAYRQRSSVFIKGLNLGNSGQLPVLSFELLSEALQGYTAENFATFPHDVALDTAPFLSGISAMDPGGFDFIYGINYDNFNGGHLGYKVFHVDSAGAITETFELTYGAKESNALQGNSDVSVLVVDEFDPAFIPQVDHFTMYKTDGSSVVFSYGVTANADQWTFSKRGDRAAIASVTFGGIRKIRIYNAVTGAFLAQSVMATNMQFCAIGDGVVYALASDGSQTGNVIYVVDLVTAALVDTIATPIAAVQSAITCDADGNLYLFAIGGVGNEYPVYKWNGSAWTKILNETLLYSTPSERHAYYANNGVLATQRFDSSGFAPYREQFYIAVSRVASVEVPLDELVTRLSLRTKLIDASEFDVTALASDTIKGLAVSQVTPTRVVLEMLMKGKLFGASENGTKIVYTKRGGASQVTIPFADIGISADGTEEPFPRNKRNDVEFPRQIVVKYSNFLNDYQTGAESGDRLVTTSTSTEVTELPLVMTPAQAKKVADVATSDLQTSLLSIGPLKPTKKYLKHTPNDVVTVTDRDGNLYRARIDSIDITNFQPTWNLVLDDATAVNSNVATDSAYESSTLIVLPAVTDLEVLDAPILRDADNALGPYLAVSGPATWGGAKAYKSTDNVAFVDAGTLTTKTAIGTASTILGDFGSNGFDEINSVTANFGSAATLSSYSKANALAGTAAAYLIGSEIVIACTATFVSAGVYTLSTFLRGLRGTEWAKAGHVAAERVVQLLPSGAGLRKITDDVSEWNATRYYKGVSLGKNVSLIAGEAFVDTGVALKPFAPVDLHLDTSGASSVSVTWNRRSRLQSGSLFGSAPALGETTEAYDYELTSGVTVVESGTVTSPAYTASGLVGGDYIVPPIWGLRSIGGDLIAVRDDIPYTTRSMKTLVKIDSAGTVVQSSPNLAETMAQWCNNGDSIYAAFSNITNPPPNSYTDTKVQKFTRATLNVVDATYTGATPGDVQGIAHDGTNVWIAEFYSGNLRKLNATTLVSVAAYAITGGPRALQHNAGKLWVSCLNSHDLVKWDIATQTEDARIALGERCWDLLVAGSLVYAACESFVKVFDLSGTLVTTLACIPADGETQRSLSTFSTYVVVMAYPPGYIGGVKLYLLTATTGALANTVSTPVAEISFVAGGDGSDLYITGRAGSGYSLQTRKYAVAPPGLTGYTLTVWQKSATVGRGYPASLEL